MKIGNITGTLVLLVQFLQVASWCNNPDQLLNDGWTLYNGALYNSFDHPSQSQTEWESFCQNYGGSLVTIKNADENAFVYSIKKSWCYHYIGLTFDGVNWMWSDGTPALWTNWLDGGKVSILGVVDEKLRFYILLHNSNNR